MTEEKKNRGPRVRDGYQQLRVSVTNEQHAKLLAYSQEKSIEARKTFGVNVKADASAAAEQILVAAVQALPDVPGADLA